MAAVTGVTGLAFEARIAAGRHTRVICSGDGAMLAASIAGAVTEGSTIVSETTQVATDRNWSRALLQLIPDAVHGAIFGSATVVSHPEAKRDLHASTGALAVDNESHVVASVAAARGLPMAAV